MAASIMTDKQIRRFSEHNEIDFAYSAADLGRFRVNVFRQRGSISVVLRQIPTRSRRSRSSAFPRSSSGWPRAPRPRPGHRPDRLGQVDDAGGDDRPHQQHHAPPHRDRGGSDRVRSTTTRSRSSTSARSASTPTATARRCRRVLRQDPDVILIGEMRDPETVSAALTAAETGHLVITTLHTIDATETINRIIDFFPPHQQKQIRIMLAGTLQGIISQRLLVRATARPRAGHRDHGVHQPHPRLHPRPGPGEPHRRRHQRGRLLRHADLRPGAARPVRGRPHHLADAAQVASNPHDFKLLVQSQGHDVSLMTF